MAREGIRSKMLMISSSLYRGCDAESPVHMMKISSDESVKRRSFPRGGLERGRIPRQSPTSEDLSR